jgi:type IV secretion system protein VirB1
MPIPSVPFEVRLAAILLSLCSFGAHAADSDMASLMSRCAPKVHIETLGAIVRTESSGHTFVLSDDGPRDLPWEKRKNMVRSLYPSTAAEASALARSLIDSGHLVGIGLTQVSSQHLARFGVSVEQLLDPCTNLAVGGRILSDLFGKAKASPKYPDEQLALGAAISAFNTGNFEDGFANGYVRKVLINAGARMPELRSAAPIQQRVAKASAKSRTSERVVILPASDGVQQALR